MRSLVVAAVAALSLLVAAGAPGTAGAKTYCQKATAGKKVLKRTDGVTVYADRSLISACSDAKRRNVSLTVLDEGYRFAKVVSTGHRCLALLFTSKKGLPQMAFKDLAGSKTGTDSQSIGYGQESATVASMSMSSNCAVAWGESTSDGTFHIRVRPISRANSLPEGAVTDVATVTSAEDIQSVTATAQGKRVKVSWTQAGTPMSAVL
jgi:hypothetical protein